jgi:hypothetical protein
MPPGAVFGFAVAGLECFLAPLCAAGFGVTVIRSLADQNVSLAPGDCCAEIPTETSARIGSKRKSFRSRIDSPHELSNSTVLPATVAG